MGLFSKREPEPRDDGQAPEEPERDYRVGWWSDKYPGRHVSDRMTAAEAAAAKNAILAEDSGRHAIVSWWRRR